MTLEQIARGLCALDGIDPDLTKDGAPAWEHAVYLGDASRLHQVLTAQSEQPDLFSPSTRKAA